MFETIFGISTRTRVLDLVYTMQGASLKEIYMHMSRENKISYQAVHKLLNQLIGENILKKKQKNYFVNEVWVQKLQQVVYEIDAFQGKVVQEFNIDPNFKKQINLKFDNYRNMILFIVKSILMDKVKGHGPDIACGSFVHLYMPFDLNFRDYQLIYDLTKKCDKVFAYSPSDSSLDRWVCKQYLKAGFYGAKIGVKEKLSHTLIIHGDGIFEVSCSKETNDILDKVYNRTKDVNDLFKEVFFKKDTKQKLEFHVKISKNPQIAEMLRKQILSTIL